jgi:hypothetical protein
LTRSPASIRARIANKLTEECNNLVGLKGYFARIKISAETAAHFPVTERVKDDQARKEGYLRMGWVRANGYVSYVRIFLTERCSNSMKKSNIIGSIHLPRPFGWPAGTRHAKFSILINDCKQRAPSSLAR